MKKRKGFYEALKRKGITAYKVAKTLGYSETGTVYKWIYGISEPNAVTMLKLMSILDISAEEVLQMFAEEATETEK